MIVLPFAAIHLSFDDFTSMVRDYASAGNSKVRIPVRIPVFGVNLCCKERGVCIDEYI